MWMSLAPMRTASASSVLTSFTTGAFCPSAPVMSSSSLSSTSSMSSSMPSMIEASESVVA